MSKLFKLGFAFFALVTGLSGYAPKAVAQQVILLDAGHGGKDAGVIEEGVQEKDIVLDVTQRLFARLEADNAFKPIMTRTNDGYISFQKRKNVAMHRNADYVISIHADSSPQKSDQGASAFIFKQNEASLENLKSDFPYLTETEIAENHARSTQLAKNLLAGIAKENVLFKPEPIEANFSMLRLPKPAVLLELGMLSHPEDRAKLTDPAYREKIAEAIYQSIQQFAPSYAK